LRVELEIVSDLTAADQTTTAAAIEPPRANMGAHIKSRPAIEREWPRWRAVGRATLHVGGFGDG
jgi:hypothetical protein